MQTNGRSKLTKIVSNDFHCDVIGKPDPVTNLRPIKCHVPQRETNIEKLFRIERLQVQEWNDRFWRRHNEMFKIEKEQYRQKHVSVNSNNVTDELSKFYQDFLDRNWKAHCWYNVQWYKKNLYLSSLALRVNVSRLLRCCKKI